MNWEKITLMVAVVLTFAYITIPGFPPDFSHGMGLFQFSHDTTSLGDLSLHEDLLGIIVFFMPYILLRLWKAK